jgi:hypothetical protein
MDDPYAHPEPPGFDEDLARRILGKRVLVGVSYLEPGSDRVLRLEQFHGVVARASREEGVILRLNDGTERWLPPDLSRLEPASPGSYRLKGTGEAVVDPDYLSTWNVYPKPTP